MGNKEFEEAAADVVKAARKKISKAKKGTIKVTDYIVVHMTFEKDGSGWVHSHGLWDFFDLPDLEIRGVRPKFMIESAGVLINQVAQYMVNMKGVKEIIPGQNMILHNYPFSFVDRLNATDCDDQEHYKTPRFGIVEVATPPTCSVCKEGGPGHELHGS